MLALESLSMEREAARGAAHEAAQRSSALAAEVVALEQVWLCGGRGSCGWGGAGRTPCPNP